MKKLFTTILCLTMLLFMVPTMVRAEETDDVTTVTKMVTGKEEFAGLMTKYYDDLNNNANNVVFPLYVGTNKIDLSNSIEISYLTDGQEELFDYTFENGVITLKVKDYDLYNALISGKDITPENFPDVVKKLEKYLEPEEGSPDILSGMIGVRVKIYIPEGLEKSVGEYILNNGEDGHYEFVEFKSEFDHDAKGNYYDFVYGGTLAHYFPDINGWINGYRFIGSSTGNIWNKGYFLIRNYVADAASLGIYGSYNNEYFENANYATLAFKYELAATTIEDSNTGVSVTGKKDIDSTLTVEKLDTKADVYKELNKRLEGKKVLGAFEVKLNGDYEGKLSVSFNVDSKYNGEKATVLHKKNNGTIETFEKEIIDGKVTVEVDELSPFVIALSNVKADSTPTLGVPSYIGLASLLVLCAGVCLIKVLKKD